MWNWSLFLEVKGGCNENEDPENEDLRPEKRRPPKRSPPLHSMVFLVFILLVPAFDLYSESHKFSGGFRFAVVAVTKTKTPRTNVHYFFRFFSVSIFGVFVFVTTSERVKHWLQGKINSTSKKGKLIVPRIPCTFSRVPHSASLEDALMPSQRVTFDDVWSHWQEERSPFWTAWIHLVLVWIPDTLSQTALSWTAAARTEGQKAMTQARNFSGWLCPRTSLLEKRHLIWFQAGRKHQEIPDCQGILPGPAWRLSWGTSEKCSECCCGNSAAWHRRSRQAHGPGVNSSALTGLHHKQSRHHQCLWSSTRTGHGKLWGEQHSSQQVRPLILSVDSSLD